VDDEVVGDLAEVLRGDHRGAELFEGVGVGLLDAVDQVVEPDPPDRDRGHGGLGGLGGIRHARSSTPG